MNLRKELEPKVQALIQNNNFLTRKELNRNPSNDQRIFRLDKKKSPVVYAVTNNFFQIHLMKTNYIELRYK